MLPINECKHMLYAIFCYQDISEITLKRNQGLKIIIFAADTKDNFKLNFVFTVAYF